MEKSIRNTVCLYAALQLFLILVLSYAIRTDRFITVICGVISIVHHGILYIALIKLKSNFYNLSRNEPMTHVNLANKITLFRISSLPTIASLLVPMNTSDLKLVLPVMMAVIFLTDSFDGQIARRGRQITRMGAMLDSVSDYLLLGLISIVYYRNSIVPHWLFYLITVRLLFQPIGMIVFMLLKKPVEIKSTWGGKVTVAITMTLYVGELVRLYLPEKFDIAFRLAEYACGLVIFLLYFEKGVIFVNHGRNPNANPNDKTS